MKKKQQQIAVLLLVVLIAGMSIYFIGDYVGLWAAGPDDDDTTPKLTSTFTLIDYNTGEDVSAWVEVSVWTPDPDDVPFDDSFDVFRIANFDEDVSSSDAEDVAIDLRDHAYAWLQIDPDYESDYGGYNGVFAAMTTDDFRLMFGGINFDYIFYVFHEPSNVSVNVLNRGDMDAVGGDGVGNADEWGATIVSVPANYSRTDQGNFTTYLNLPFPSALGLHAGVTGGDEWDIDDDDLADMTVEEIMWLQSQENFRTIAPYYDLVDDNTKNYGDELELWTNCFAVNITFNDSISVDDADSLTTQVNFTLLERDYNEIPAEIVFTGSSILVIFYAPITCYDMKYSFDFEFACGHTINATSVTTGRIETPEDDDNLGDWIEYNTAPIFDLWT